MLNFKKLQHRISQDKENILKGRKYHFIDNGSNVLAVVHADVAPSIYNIRRSYRRTDDDFVLSPSLDDRLGLTIILDELPKLGINVDVLITDDEEIGRSTAQLFNPTKSYNWMFQFDRRGHDVVMYNYETTENVRLLERFGFEVGVGSFSDICYLDFLGIVGFNFGTGYYLEHTKNSYADLQLTSEMVEKFARFYHNMKDIKLSHEPYYDVVFEKRHDEFCDCCGKGLATVYLPNEEAFICTTCRKILGV
jgi:hypothetical protein